MDVRSYIEDHFGKTYHLDSSRRALVVMDGAGWHTQELMVLQICAQDGRLI